ncbi:MAG TPA: aspartate/glutamate racemase family protein [Symbiobacteriaceae bacterium]|jgi:Asp/Glu/hydantoin racemase|nr:aspartate/glutamate racemase family protein [Symbiobacteriaceae bacterium]
MPKTLALLHTTPMTVTGLKELAAEHVPGVRIINLLDDSLLADVMAAGGVTPEVEGRMRAYIDQAKVAGADAVLCCCSSVGEVIERARPGAALPVLRIDEPMAEAAVKTGSRIGVVATVGTTLEPTANLIRRKATELGRNVTVEALKVEGAYQALTSGRPDEHDALVLKALEGLLQRSDVIVLAQASLARVAGKLTTQIPILSSPVSGLQAAAKVVTAKD